MWERMKEIAATNDITEGTVISVNNGGAIVKITSRDYKGTVKAFLPNSHLSIKSTCTATSTLIGTVLPLQIVSISDYSMKNKHRRLVVSHKWAVREQLKTGDVVHDGIVTAIKSYGAFIAFNNGSIQGLLHKNQISHNDWKLVRNDNEDGYIIDNCFRDEWETNQVLLKVGSHVKCMIIRKSSNNNNNNNNKDKNVDHHHNRRISLSTETLESEPGDMLCDPQLVFEKAEETALRYMDRLELEDFLSSEIATMIPTSTKHKLLSMSTSTCNTNNTNNNNDNEPNGLLRP